MTRNFIDPQKNLFVMFDKVLTPCDITGAILNAQGNVIAYLVNLQGNSSFTEVSADTKFYLTERDFKEGTTILPTDTYLHDILFDDEKNCIYIERWMMVNGEPKNVELHIANFIFGENGVNLANPDDVEYIVGEAYDPRIHFCSREDCLAHNDYKVRLDDGTEVVRTGIAKMVALTEEQTKLKDELVDLLDRMEKAGITMFDNITYGSSFILANTKDIDVVSCYGQDRSDDVEFDGEYLTYIDNPCYYQGEEDTFYYRQKKVEDK